jgi:leader peptidase (prepilin peptidase)/N-methyltransferase
VTTAVSALTTPGLLPPGLTWLLTVVVSAVLGSFLNVCISRLPHRQSVVRPASHCPRCGAPIRPRDNIPLLSFALLGGRCRACRARISWRYPIVEALAVSVGVLVLWRLGPTAAGLRAFVLGLLLIAVVFTDLEHHLIPDRLTLPGLVAGLGLRLYPAPGAVVDGVLGGLVAGGLFWLIAEASYRILGKDGMGGGDIKLAAMLGAFLGLPLVLTGIFLGVLVGGITAMALLVLGLRRFGQYVAFGPFLAVGGFVSALWGRHLLDWYLG